MSQETKKYLIEEALVELNSKASKKFTESLDVSINLGIDASKSDQNVRGASNLPHCLLYTSPSPRDRSLSRMPSSA